MKILIIGDFFIADKFSNPQFIDNSVFDLFTKADYRIVNLEAPITKNNPYNKIIKTGPHLWMSEETTIKHLKELNIDCVTLANNHILDFGGKGLFDTLESLNKYNISFIGAGNNLSDAAKYLSIEKDGLKIAIINFCENEWSIAEDDSPGANPMDIIDNTNQIREAKASHDKVIVIVHGGHEYYNLPSPRMQKQYRFYADQGADIVIGHHTHCISGNEVYKGVPIYYSLGNFLFTKLNTNDEWYTGLILEIDISKEKIDCKIHPVRQDKEGYKLSLLEGFDKEKVLCRYETYCNVIDNPDELQVHWEYYVKKQSKEYLNYWSPVSFIQNRYIAAIFRRMGVNFLNKKGMALFLNLIRCEAHWDMNKEIIGKYLKK